MPLTSEYQDSLVRNFSFQGFSNSRLISQPLKTQNNQP
ncbi:hypothetical protein BCLUESOX_1262 [bacterium endosymbiont of Bathymodiolus sp. 5 South]|nr:hypothetical protein [uncultured Gammaproteobacteria bacterium]SHN93932.1 hypothetical protein BCLUESOX_1262 [bacterium endosymbiont of Bathymodiolus sp. 5 South]VVH57432.1 hypothetical protein BSPCLSOX_433 [uncultured Gammaproteobacteria bacterium]